MSAIVGFSKELILYSTIVLAGTVLILKKLFPKKKINKKIYDKNRKKILIKTKLFFDDLTKNVDVVKFQKDEQVSNNKLYKLKKFVEKVTQESILINTSNENSLKSPPSSKKDQIFYLLLNNMSNIMIKTSNNTSLPK